jgi:HD-GYP domain-containing protein (c-di-GMP phosphodiesterase class II)
MPRRRSRTLARCQHERFDGTGYPCGLAAQNVPLAAHVVPVADAFDAITKARCYRPVMTDDVALSTVANSSGAHFGPDVVEAFVDAIPLVLRARETANEQDSLSDNAVMVAKFYGCESPGLASFTADAPSLTATTWLMQQMFVSCHE